MADSERAPLTVLVAGGGVAALEATLALRALAEDRVAIQLLAPENDFTYRPLAVAEPFRAGQVERLPLAMLAKEAGAGLRRGKLAAVDADRKTVVTESGVELAYDVLLLTLGARPRQALPGAFTFGGPEDDARLASLLEDVRGGEARRVVFALPAGVTWPFPLYELALLTGMHLSDSGVLAFELTLVTPEAAPLALFGESASEAVRDLLGVRGIRLRTNVRPAAFDNGLLRLDPEGALEADRVVTLPVLEGAPIDGVPQDADGFVPTDGLGRVEGLDDVYAAGDLTEFPVKQGGLAAQQADAAASAIAARAGASVTPEPFRPVLRGLLLTGGVARYLRGDAEERTSIADTEPLWWPPAKIVGRHLAPFLAAHTGLSERPGWVDEAGPVPVEVELEYKPTGARPIA